MLGALVEKGWVKNMKIHSSLNANLLLWKKKLVITLCWRKIVLWNGVMESNNLMDKYAIAVKKSDESIVGHLPLGKSANLQKTIFYILF